MKTNNSLDYQALLLFEAAIEIDEVERQEWIEKQAAGQPELLAKTLALLKQDLSDGNYMQTGMAFSDTEDEYPIPSRIGAYKVTGFIGQGGMGAVYKGERDTGDFNLIVAIKLVRLGVFSDKLVARFEHERQTLAKMAHPNIARLYDGGTTLVGEENEAVPYFIMEYVDGAPLLQWIKSHQLKRVDKLALFRKVCDAISYAHQNLIIHRDITPSNIMVTHSGEVKLIDFGIAKPFSTLIKEDIHSLDTGLSFTPGFAAPERRKGELSNTLSDIYSLGKLLEAMLLSSSKLELVEKDKQAELNFIIAKASACDPQQRYKTVNSLVDELYKYEQNFPISAYPNSQLYRLKKFIKRHRKGVLLSTVSLLAIVVALIVSISQYQRAESNLEQANIRFNEIRELSTYQIFELYDELSRVAGTTAARANLANKAQSYLAILAKSENADHAVKLETAQGYLRLAYIYGIPAQANLGEPEQASEHLHTAERLLNQLSESNDIIPNKAITQAAINAARAMLLIHNEGMLAEAKTLLDSAYSLLTSVAPNNRGVYWHKTRRALRNSSLERADQAGLPDELRQYADAFVNDIKEWPAELQESYLKEQDENYYFYWLGAEQYISNNFAKAAEYFTLANEKLSSVEQEQKNDPMLLYQLAWTNYLGYGASAREEYNPATEPFLTRTSEYVNRLLAVEENDSAIENFSISLREAQSQLYAANGDFEKAIAIQQGVVNTYKDAMEYSNISATGSNLGFSYIILAYMQRDVDDIAAACNSLIEAEKVLHPLAEQKVLPLYMDNAAKRLPSRIQQCKSGQTIESMNALFD